LPYMYKIALPVRINLHEFQ